MTSSSSSSLKEGLKSLGPGIITGAADDDPSGIATFSQAVWIWNAME
jgi:Mn2+/Fe2+ NRAMP family transporter